MLKSLLVLCALTTVVSHVVSADPEWEPATGQGHSPPSDKWWIKLVKRGTAFSHPTSHSQAFEVVHVIAAVIGIIGAVAIGATVFLACRRRNRRRQRQLEEQGLSYSPACSEHAFRPSLGLLPPTAAHTNGCKSMSASRFDQFASAFCHEEYMAASRTSTAPIPCNNAALSRDHATTFDARDNPDLSIISHPPPPYRP